MELSLLYLMYIAKAPSSLLFELQFQYIHVWVLANQSFSIWTTSYLFLCLPDLQWLEDCICEDLLYLVWKTFIRIHISMPSVVSKIIKLITLPSTVVNPSQHTFWGYLCVSMAGFYALLSVCLAVCDVNKIHIQGLIQGVGRENHGFMKPKPASASYPCLHSGQSLRSQGSKSV